MNLSDHDSAIRDLEPLNRLPRAAQNAVLAQARLLGLRPGETLYHRGERDPLCYFLLQGEVEFVLHGQGVKEARAGEKIASRALNRAGAHGCTVRTLTPACVLVLDRALLERQVELAEAALHGRQNGADWLGRTMRSGLLAHLPDHNMRLLLALLREVQVGPGEVVMREGEPGDCYFIVREGRCEVQRRGPAGELVHLEELGPGDGFGEQALLTGRPREATVTLLTEGRLMRLEQSDFMELVAGPLLRRVSRAELEPVERRGVVWLDLRPAVLHARAALPGSVNLPYELLRNRARALAPEERYLVASSDPLDARVGAFLLAERGFDAACLDEPIDALLAERAVPAVEPVAELPSPSFPPSLVLAGEGPEAMLAREALQERTAPPAPREDSAVAQAAAAGSAMQAEFEAALRAQAPGVPPAAPPPEFEQSEVGLPPPPSPPEGADPIARVMQSIELQLRETLDQRLTTVRQHYESELLERSERLRQQAVQEILRRDAERELQLREAYEEKEKTLRQHYRKLIDLANRIGAQREQVQAAREQLKQRIEQANELQREVHQMRSVLAQSLDQLEAGQAPSDKVLNRSIRTLLTG